MISYFIELFPIKSPTKCESASLLLSASFVSAEQKQ